MGGQPAGIKPCPCISKGARKQSLWLPTGGSLSKNTSSLPEDDCSWAKFVSYSLISNKKLSYSELNYGKFCEWMYIIYDSPPRQIICNVLIVLRTCCHLFLCCFYSTPKGLIKHIRSNWWSSAMLNHPMSLFILKTELIPKKDAVMTFQELTHFISSSVNWSQWGTGWDRI